MKKLFATILCMLVLTFPIGLKAQDIRVNRFEENYTSLIARMNPVHDNAGEACAVLRCYVRGKNYTIEPNLGIVKSEKLDGEIRLWVPRGTKRITVRHKGAKPLVGFSIPVTIESKTDYDVDIETMVHNSEVINEDNFVYAGVGYQVMAISGPSLAVGVNMNHHIIELGAVYGLNKTDDLYFFNSSGDVKAGFNYRAIKAYLKYGYEIPLSDFFSITPQAGSAYNAYSGTDVANSGSSATYKSASSLSLLLAARMAVPISKGLQLSLTPEYDGAIYKDETCKLVSSNDDSMKKWHTGFNLNVGLVINF